MLRDEITRTTFQSGEEIRLSEDWTAVVEEKAGAIRNSEASEQLAMLKKESRVLYWSRKTEGFQAELHIDEIV